MSNECRTNECTHVALLHFSPRDLQDFRGIIQDLLLTPLDRVAMVPPLFSPYL